MGTFCAGYIFDIFGRRITLFVAFSACCFLLFLIPHTAPHVFPWLLIIRIVFQIFCSPPASNPLVADYVHKDAIGKASVLIALGLIIGEVLSMGILFPITKNMSPNWSFATAAIVGACMASVMLFGVKEP